MAEAVPEPAEDPWRVAFVEFKTRDEKMVKDYQEEIDTLLVFVRHPHHLFIIRLIIFALQAGLFSAVLTAFVVESYQSLQEDHTKTSADLLRHISHQLANSSFPAAPDSSQFHAQRSDVRVNICWFVSLLLSLVVALFGIFLKQWMRTYIKWTDVTPDQEAVAIRQFRYRGRETWRLGAILTLLPTLLQLSVILFLTGLLMFLWNLDPMVADVMAVLLATTFFLVAAVTVLPAVSQSCPFRSPLSEILAVTFWRVADYANFLHGAIWAFINSGWKYSPDSRNWRMLAGRWRYRSTLTSWVQADEAMIERYDNNKDHISMRVGAIVHLCCTTQSQILWSATIAVIVAECLANNPAASYGIGDVYYNEVWWPLLAHIGLATKKDVEFGVSRLYYSTLPMSTRSAFRHLSLLMKRYWVNFLLESKMYMCQADSTLVAESYMICCVASIESTTGGLCMQAFMEVLEAQYANLRDSQLIVIANCIMHSPRPALLHSILGLLFLGKIVSRVEHLPQTSSLLRESRPYAIS
jgi:hypothetical protein